MIAFLYSHISTYQFLKIIFYFKCSLYSPKFREKYRSLNLFSGLLFGRILKLAKIRNLEMSNARIFYLGVIN
jgi:hypothetical protein